MKRENPDISLSQKTTQNSKNNQTNNQPSLSEIRMENSEKTDEIFERLGAASQNNQAIQSEQTIQNNFVTKITETINFEAIQSLEKNSKEKDDDSKNEEKSNNKGKNKN